MFDKVFMRLSQKSYKHPVSFCCVILTPKLLAKLPPASNQPQLTIDRTPTLVIYHEGIPKAKYTGSKFDERDVDTFLETVLSQEIYKDTQPIYSQYIPQRSEVMTPIRGIEYPQNTNFNPPNMYSEYQTRSSNYNYQKPPIFPFQNYEQRSDNRNFSSSKDKHTMGYTNERDDFQLSPGNSLIPHDRPWKTDIIRM